jgi:NADPH:quinone reductase
MRLPQPSRCLPPNKLLQRSAQSRVDLIALVDLLRQQRIKPLIAQRFPLAEARRAHELLGQGGVIGKIMLVCNGSSL